MTALQIYKAQGMGAASVESVAIHIETEMPDSVSLAACRQLHAAQAELLVDALLRSLPGGTIDAVLYTLMQRRASLFVVPHLPEEALPPPSPCA